MEEKFKDKTGIQLIQMERAEHFGKHEKDLAYDIEQNNNFQLGRGARKLLAKAELLTEFPPEGWDKELWTKICHKTYLERLIIAGSLIAAEIDRINK
jgi:hypothetical protein